jgi:hypothetical protein
MTLLEACKHPMTSMQNMRSRPPQMTIVRRPNLSTVKKAGIDIKNMSIAETPDARNDAVEPGRPACAKSVGAYW